MDRWKQLGEGIPERLRRQLEFILEIDRLKSVLRQSYLIDSDRHENSAEHSWHLAVAAMVLAEHAKESAVMAQAVLERMEVELYDADQVMRLIGMHLEMSAALRRDIFDAEAVRAFAAKVQTHEMLRMLTLLTYAGVGALVAARQPRNPLGWLLLAEGFLFTQSP